MRAFAFAGSFVMLAILFGPAIEASAAALTDVSPVPGDPSGSEAAQDSESAPPPDGSTDSPGGPSPQPGTIDSVYAPPSPILSETPSDAVPPRLNETLGEYVYTTVAGAYSFPKVTPFLLQYKTAEGQALVAASTFLVLAPTPRSSSAPRYSMRRTTDIRSGTGS